MAVTSDDTSPVALHLFPATAFYTLYLPFTSAIAMVVVDSTTRRSPTERDVVQIPTASAHNICDGLFRMVNCFIPELPEAELRDVRNILETLLTKVDRLLDHTECDLSLNFDNLAVNAGKFHKSRVRTPTLVSLSSGVRHYPDGEDFGASTVSTSITIADTGRSALPSPPRRRRETTRIPVTPAPTPAPIPDPTPILIPTHGQFPLVLSSRENVGFPDYTHHPLFIRPGSSFIFTWTTQP